ncbi:prenyltransferase [Halomarina litorea]|uniref:prenyltransferase n=1 Tax=Halomarina litorea TaxID=2961595 RepID=UPI0020C430AD|nr:prenyltransferase [Halomarina sp. BCD28]
MAFATSLDDLLPPASTRSGYLLRLSRPRFWFYLAGPVVVGVTYAAETPGELFAPLALALFAYFLLPANVYLYGVNDVFDADVDEHNEKKDDREVRYRGGRLVVGVVLASALLAVPFAFVLPWEALVAFLAFGLLATEYSAPPLRFKTTPFLDSLSNGLYVLPGVVGYAALAGEWPPWAAVAGAWLWTMGMHTFSAIPDIEPDRAAGIRTTATFLGKSRTYLYCAVCWVAAAAVFGLVHPFFATVLGAYPVIVLGIVRSEVDVSEAYWWYPAINTLVGMLITMAGLWVLLYG